MCARNRNLSFDDLHAAQCLSVKPSMTPVIDVMIKEFVNVFY